MHALSAPAAPPAYVGLREGGVLEDTPAQAANAPAWLAWRWPTALFALTVLTTLFAGATRAGSRWSLFDLPILLSQPDRLLEHLALGVPFAASMMGILGVHELGHYVFARRHGVDATPPYFIPFPSLLGTMGAVIRLKGRMPTRTALVDVGVSGPLAGVAVALPLLVVGLSLSGFAPLPDGPRPAQTLPEIFREVLSPGAEVVAATGILVPGESLLVAAVRALTLGPVPDGHYLQLHPVAWAAVFGLFVTALNLLPVGQLDGGHASYALTGPLARYVGRLMVVVLVVLGFVAWPGWLLWALLAGRLLGTRHPPVERPDVPLPRSRQVAAAVSLALLPAIFAPTPVYLL